MADKTFFFIICMRNLFLANAKTSENISLNAFYLLFYKEISDWKAIENRERLRLGRGRTIRKWGNFEGGFCKQNIQQMLPLCFNMNIFVQL